MTFGQNGTVNLPHWKQVACSAAWPAEDIRPSVRLQITCSQTPYNARTRTQTHKHTHTPWNKRTLLLGRAFKRAPQLRVDLAFCHDIYIYYRKRGSASYIVREWLLWVVERERETPVPSSISRWNREWSCIWLPRQRVDPMHMHTRRRVLSLHLLSSARIAWQAKTTKQQLLRPRSGSSKIQKHIPEQPGWRNSKYWGHIEKRNQINTKKLLEIEKEIVREVVRGDKHNLRKSANCKAQISRMCGVNDTDLCVAIYFLRLCLSPRTTSRTISFSIYSF